MVLRLTSFRAIAALLTLSSLMACSKKSDDIPEPTIEPNPTPFISSMAWTEDGVAVSAPFVVTQLSGTNAVEIFSTNGTAAGGPSLGLTVPTQTGTFAVSNTGTTAARVLYFNPTTPSFQGTAGSIVVTAHTPAPMGRITGTFSFTIESFATPPATKPITNGTFNVQY